MTDDNGESDVLPERSEQLAEGLGRAAASPVTILVTFLRTLARSAATAIFGVLPKGDAFWKGMLKLSAYRYQKAANGDAVAFTHLPNGSVEPESVKYVPGDDVDEKPGWSVRGRDKVWSAASEGRDVERMGKANIIMADEDSHETGSILQCRFAEALELDNIDYLLHDPVVEQQITVDATANGDTGSALADGGYQQRNVLADPGEVADGIVDLASEDGHDGMRVSARKYKEVYQEKSSSEEMKNQELRGRLAERDMDDLKSFMWKVMLAASAVALGGLIGPELVAGLFGSGGGGGGGGGGLMPFALPPLKMAAIGMVG